MRFSFKSDDDRSWPSDDKGKAAAGVAAGVAAGGAEQPPSGFVQDRFAISFFLDPSPTDAAYEFIRDANCKTTAPSLSVLLGPLPCRSEGSHKKLRHSYRPSRRQPPHREHMCRSGVCRSALTRCVG